MGLGRVFAHHAVVPEDTSAVQVVRVALRHDRIHEHTKQRAAYTVRLNKKDTTNEKITRGF